MLHGGQICHEMPGEDPTRNRSDVADGVRRWGIPQQDAAVASCWRSRPSRARPL